MSVLKSEVEAPPIVSKGESDLPIITGWLSRQVKQGEKFVPRFLKTKDKVLCSFQKDPSKVAMGEEAPRVKNALDMNKIAEIKSDGANGFTIYLKSEDLDEKDGEHPGYLFRPTRRARKTGSRRSPRSASRPHGAQARGHAVPCSADTPPLTHALSRSPPFASDRRYWRIL